MYVFGGIDFERDYNSVATAVRKRHHWTHDELWCSFPCNAVSECPNSLVRRCCRTAVHRDDQCDQEFHLLLFWVHVTLHVPFNQASQNPRSRPPSASQPSTSLACRSVVFHSAMRHEDEVELSSCGILRASSNLAATFHLRSKSPFLIHCSLLELPLLRDFLFPELLLVLPSKSMSCIRIQTAATSSQIK